MSRPDSGASSFLNRGGLWVAAQFAAMLGWLLLTPIGHTFTHSLAMRTADAILLAAGAAAGISGALVLGRSRTPFPKPPEDTALVRHGIYAFIRHPLYASLIALSLGWVSLWESPLGAALAVAQAILLDAKARREERWLREKFPDYADYAAKVRRLIPWIY